MRVLLVVLTWLGVCYSAGPNDFQTASLKAHNGYRAKHKHTPPMTLDKNLNSKAQKCAQYYANIGRIDHTCKAKYSAGESLHLGTGGSAGPVARVTTAAKAFYDENKFYNYNKPGFRPNTGHFTQLIWAKSTKLGVGYVKKGNYHYVVNLYLPAGNMISGDAFQHNVKRPK